MQVSPVIPALRYEDAKRAIDILVEAFGFEAHAVYEGDGGTIDHAQLVHGSGMVMLGSTKDDAWDELGPAAVYVIVDDCDTHHARAAGAGVEIVMEPEDQEYGGRLYTARDHEGNWWSFGTYDPTAGGS